MSDGYGPLQGSISRQEFQKWEVLSLSMVSDDPSSICIIYIQMCIHTRIKNTLRRLERVRTTFRAYPSLG